MKMDIAEIRELARRFSPEQIEQCIGRQLEAGENVCLRDGPTEKIVNELAKAQFIRELVGKGMSFPDALRELARRMRELQKENKINE
jgi:hypothetical protein